MGIQIINPDFFHNELRGFVYKRVKDSALTEDIIQDVYLKVHDKAAQLKDSRAMVGWIYQIARNMIVDHFRKTSRQIDLTELAWQNEGDNFNECVSSALRKLVLTLPDKYRDAFQRIELENRSQIQMARELNISYSALKSRVQRARMMLREKIQTLLTIETDAYGNVVFCAGKDPFCCK